MAFSPSIALECTLLTLLMCFCHGSACSKLAQMWTGSGLCGSESQCCNCSASGDKSICCCLEYVTGIIIGLVGLQLVTLLVVFVETCYICCNKRTKMDKGGIAPSEVDNAHGSIAATLNRNEDSAIASFQASPNPAYSLFSHDPTQSEFAPGVTIPSAQGNTHKEEPEYANTCVAPSENQIGASECPVPLPGNYSKVTPRSQREVAGARVTKASSREPQQSSPTYRNTHTETAAETRAEILELPAANIGSFQVETEAACCFYEYSKELTADNELEGSASSKDNERKVTSECTSTQDVHKNEVLNSNRIGGEMNVSFPHSLLTKEGRHSTYTTPEVSAHRPSSVTSYARVLPPEIALDSIISGLPLLSIKELSTNTSITSNTAALATDSCLAETETIVEQAHASNTNLLRDNKM